MPSNPKKHATTLDDVITSLETLRSHLVDLEALAHSAAQAIEHIPYMPRRRPGEAKSATSEQRRGVGRLQTLVVATADAAEVVLGEIDQIIDAATEGSGPEGGSGNGPVGGSGNSQEPDSREGAALDDDAIPDIIEDTTTLPRVRAGIVLDGNTARPCA